MFWISLGTSLRDRFVHILFGYDYKKTNLHINHKIGQLPISHPPANQTPKPLSRLLFPGPPPRLCKSLWRRCGIILANPWLPMMAGLKKNKRTQGLGQQSARTRGGGG